MSEDYSKAKIYKIVNNNDNKIYVGSTIYPLSHRLGNHTRSSNACSSAILFKENGVDNCEIILIENYPCSSREELNIREEYYRKKYIDFCVNKYSCYQSPEDLKEWSKKYYEKNKDKFKEYQKKYREENKDGRKLERTIKKYQDEVNDINKQIYLLQNPQ